MDDHELEDCEAPADLQVLEPTVQAAQITEYIPLALREAAKEAAVLLYMPRADPYSEEIVKNSDRVFYFDEGPRAERGLLLRLMRERRGARPRWRPSRKVALAA